MALTATQCAACGEKERTGRSGSIEDIRMVNLST